MFCPLCQAPISRTLQHHQLRERTFLLCEACWLISIDPQQHLLPEVERSRYLTHENDPSDARYRAFLSQVVDPLKSRIRTGDRGLDYGSGPGPTLFLMMGELGFEMENYDPYFAPNRDLLLQSYDFITCTETAEHFYRPKEDFDWFARALKPGGVLAILTQTWQTPETFANWYYPRDPTHVCFYHLETFRWIATHYAWQATLEGQNVVLFRT